LPEARAHFCGVPYQVREARRFVEATLAAWDCDDPEQIAALLTSEVTAEAVRQAAGEFTVHLDLRGQHLRVDVVDTAETEVPPVGGADPISPGSALFLVASLAEGWGRAKRVEGAGLWFETRVERRSPG
jgi:hypothetical protein